MSVCFHLFIVLLLRSCCGRQARRNVWSCGRSDRCEKEVPISYLILDQQLDTLDRSSSCFLVIVSDVQSYRSDVLTETAAETPPTVFIVSQLFLNTSRRASLRRASKPILELHQGGYLLKKSTTNPEFYPVSCENDKNGFIRTWHAHEGLLRLNNLTLDHFGGIDECDECEKDKGVDSVVNEERMSGE